MMALKCDNCGGYFDLSRGIKDANSIDIIHKDRDPNVNLVNRMDLCPACLAAVMKALEDRKMAPRMNDVDPFEDDLK